jgi:hypothetical protein
VSGLGSPRDSGMHRFARDTRLLSALGEELGVFFFNDTLITDSSWVLVSAKSIMGPWLSWIVRAGADQSTKGTAFLRWEVQLLVR